MYNFQVYASLSKIGIRLRESKGFLKIDSNHHGKRCNTEGIYVIPFAG